MSDMKQSDDKTLGFSSAAEEMRHNFRHVEELMKAFSSSNSSMGQDPFNLGEAYLQWLAAYSNNPEKAMQDGMEYWQKSMQLSQQAFSSLFAGESGEQPEAFITEQQGDRRFKHEDWVNKPHFHLIKQSYLMISEWMRNMVSDVEGLDAHTAAKVKFFTERYLDAMSPTNFAATNPAVIEKIAETKGASLVNGLKNMLEDLEEGQGQLKIRMSDTTAFELGENIAITPGKVVFQNRMFQLIQYSPSTDRVLKRPLLIIPPWINKFYIMDLQPKNSMLKWMVDQGHTVFVVSWINPDESYRNVRFEDYVTEGVVTAVDAVEQATGESDINVIGYCIGGTLLAIALAYMKAEGDERINSATFFTTMLDFEESGDLGVFIDEEQITELEKIMEEDGCLEGARMSGAFNLLRANDLIWSFYVNNYLLGNDPRPFDLLYWNSDSTRMSPTMHSWYLRNLYLENRLVEPNGISINGVPIDLATVDIPTCFVSTVDDHIAPWLSTYSGAKQLSGDVRFILGDSGHIAGVINHPDANKYGYRCTDGLPDDPQAWAQQAETREGSWWPEWNNWIRPLSDETVAARIVGQGGLDAIEDAPGTYVKSGMDEPAPVLSVTQLNPARKPAAAKKSVKKKSAAKAVKKKSKASVKSKKPVIDDLTRVKGIGAKLAQILNAAGLTSYAQIAGSSAESLSEILVKADSRNTRFKTTSWPEQAAALLEKQ
jgi:polyhydroxyalkanoate synthase